MSQALDYLIKRFASLWVSAAILLFAIWFKPQAIDSLAKLGVKPQLLFYSVGATGLVLSWRFNRSRTLLALVSLLVGYVFLEFFTGAGRAMDTTTASMLVGGLLCINYLVTAFLPERGVMSDCGRTAVMAITIEIALVLLLLAVPEFSSYVSHIRYYGALQAIPGSSLSIVTVMLAAATALVLLTRNVLYQSAIDAGLLVSLLAALTGLHFIGAAKVEALYFAAAALIMQITIIQDSHTRVYYDELTGLPARRALDEQLMRLGKRYVIAMIDIDLFKRFNDRFGHQVGDQALRFVASQLSRTRGRVQVFRYGGEEFTMLFNDKTIDEVLPFIEQTRARIEGTPFFVRGSSRPKDKPREPVAPFSKTRERLTVSIGVAERTGKQRMPEQVINAADQKLYKAKAAGRNCISH